MSDQFDHLSAFGIAGVRVPAREAARLLATEAQLEVLEHLRQEAEPARLTLRELREPDLSRVNFQEAVRGEIARKWHPFVQNLSSIAPPQLLGGLNVAWKSAEAKIGQEAQQKIAEIFAARAADKAAVVADEAARIAAERGLPATIRWIASLKQQCEDARRTIAQELAKFAEQRKRQLRAVESLKDDWVTLLNREDGDVTHVARRFLMLAAVVPLVGYLLWFLMIPFNSVIGMAVVAAVLLLALVLARPLMQRLRLSRRTTVTATNLVGAYRASSLLGLDEVAKRQEVEYATTLRNHLDAMLDRYRDRLAAVEARRAALREERQTLSAALHEAPPTIRVILSEETLAEWRRHGRSQAPAIEWSRRLASLREPPDWTAMGREAQAAFADLHAARAEDELYRLYPSREARMAFLQTLREAAIGATPGSAFLSLDLGVTAGKPPQVFLLVEVDDPQSSELAKDLTREWAGTGVGVSIVQASDPTMVAFVGLVYGYRLDAQRDWPSIESAFTQVFEREGRGIYPVLFPEEGEGGEKAP